MYLYIMQENSCMHKNHYITQEESPIFYGKDKHKNTNYIQTWKHSLFDQTPLQNWYKSVKLNEGYNNAKFQRPLSVFEKKPTSSVCVCVCVCVCVHFLLQSSEHWI